MNTDPGCWKTSQLGRVANPRSGCLLSILGFRGHLTCELPEPDLFFEALRTLGLRLALEPFTTTTKLYPFFICCLLLTGAGLAEDPEPKDEMKVEYRSSSPWANHGVRMAGALETFGGDAG